MHYRFLCLICLLITTILLPTGCNRRPSRVPVSGKVLVDGKPLEFGTVIFMPAVGGRQSVGNISKDGTFKLTCYQAEDGAVLGTHSVGVFASQSINKDTAVKYFVPPKYAQPQLSGLTEEIKEETDKVVINLTWKGNTPSEPYVEKIDADAAGSEEGFKRARERAKKAAANEKK